MSAQLFDIFIECKEQLKISLHVLVSTLEDLNFAASLALVSKFNMLLKNPKPAFHFGPQIQHVDLDLLPSISVGPHPNLCFGPHVQNVFDLKPSQLIWKSTPASNFVPQIQYVAFNFISNMLLKTPSTAAFDLNSSMSLNSPNRTCHFGPHIQNIPFKIETQPFALDVISLKTLKTNMLF